MSKMTGVILFLLLALTSCVKTGEDKAAVTPAVDLSKHPLYSTYQFGNEDNIIDVGSQPLAVPVGVIGELMGRDLILRKALADKGLSFRLHSFYKGSDINFFLKRGDLDVAIGGDMPMISATASYDTIVPSLAKQQFSSIVAKKSMLIKELRGQRIGNAYGSSAHYSLLQALESAGLKESDITMVRLKVSEMPDALASGTIDAFIAWEPTPTIALTKYPGFTVIHKSLNTSYLYMLKSFADAHHDAAHLIEAAQVRAMRWMRDQRKNLLKASELQLRASQIFSGREPVLSIEINADLVKNGLLSITSSPFIPEQYYAEGGRLHDQFEFLKQLVKIPADKEWAEVRRSFDSEILRNILADPGVFLINEYEYDLDFDSK